MTRPTPTEPLLPPLHHRGERSAISVEGRSLTYSELHRAAGGLARKLRGAERVAVWAEPALETCVAVVAAIAARVALVPVNPRLGPAELAHVLADSRPDVLLGMSGGALPAGTDPAARRLEVDLSARGALPLEDAGDEDPALIVYTSGTTGRPKGAVLPRRAVRSNLDALASAWDWTGEDVLAHALPLFHVHGLVLGLLGPLRRGESCATSAASTRGRRPPRSRAAPRCSSESRRCTTASPRRNSSRDLRAR